MKVKSPALIVGFLVLGAVIFFGVWNMVKNQKVVMADGKIGVSGDSAVNAPTIASAQEAVAETTA
jgi:hypothetical protein